MEMLSVLWAQRERCPPPFCDRTRWEISQSNYWPWSSYTLVKAVHSEAFSTLLCLVVTKLFHGTLLSNNFDLSVLLSSFCSCSMEIWRLMLSQSQSPRWMTNLLRSSWLTALMTLFSTLAKMVSSSHFHGCLSNMYPIAQYDCISGYNQISVKFALNLFYDSCLT